MILFFPLNHLRKTMNENFKIGGKADKKKRKIPVFSLRMISNLSVYSIGEWGKPHVRTDSFTHTLTRLHAHKPEAYTHMRTRDSIRMHSLEYLYFACEPVLMRLRLHTHLRAHVSNMFNRWLTSS